MVRDWEVSPVELAAAFLGRIEKLEPTLHAFIELQPELTLREARQRERELDAGGKLGIFHGVPIAVKDMNLAAGWHTRFGSRAFQNLFSPRDDRSVERMRAAG